MDANIQKDTASAAASLPDDASAQIKQFEPHNPMISPDLSADLSLQQAAGLHGVQKDRHGQPFYQLGDHLWLLWSAAEIIRGNLLKAKGYDSALHQAAFQNVFRCDPWMEPVPPDQILAWATHGVSGAGIVQNGRCTRELSLPLRLAEVYFAVLPDRSFIGEPTLSHPLKVHKDSPIVPLLGGLYLNGQELAPAPLDIIPVGAREDQYVRYPVFLQGGRSILIFCNGVMPLSPTPEGGRRISLAGEPHDDMRPVPIVAVEVSGVGVERYVYHGQRVRTNRRADLKPGEVILRGKHVAQWEEHVLVQQQAYAGAAGILLDVQHQPFSSAATGALSREQAERGLERDGLLLRHGAEMSALTYAVTPLLRKAELDAALGHPSSMTCGEAWIAFRAILDDTHRLHVLAHEARRRELDDDSMSGNFRQVLLCDYGSADKTARDGYLALLSRNIGINLRVCLQLGFTMQEQQASSENLSLYGRIVDSENFVLMANRYEALPLIESWLQDVVDTARVSGLSCNQYLRGANFTRLVSEMFGEAPNEMMAHVLNGINGITDPAAAVRMAARKVAWEWVRRSLARDGVELRTRALLRRVITDSGFRAFCQVDSKRLRILKDMEACKIQLPAAEKEILERNYIEYALLNNQPTIDAVACPRQTFVLLPETSRNTDSRRPGQER